MKPQVISGACVRIARAVEEALSDGALSLSPELAAHAARCPRCGPEVRSTEELLSRLRGAVVGADLRPVPHIVDQVMSLTATGGRELPKNTSPVQPEPPNQFGQFRWALGQLAVTAAVLLVIVGGTTVVALKINEAMGGAHPSDIVAHLTAPFRNWAEAQFSRSTR